jgi:FHA domain
LHERADAFTFDLLNMMPNIPILWLFLGAVVLSAWWIKVVFGASIDTEIFITVVQKLIREKNVSRCLKLTSAAGDAAVGRAIRAAILASVSREEDNNRPATYRGTRPVSMDSVRARIRAKYDAAFSEAVEPLQRAGSVALISLLLLGVAASLGALSSEFDWKLVGGAGVGFLGWLYVASQHIRILIARNKAFEALWPNLESLYHDRHTIDIDKSPAYSRPEPQAPQTTQTPPQIEKPRIAFEVLEAGKAVRSVSFAQEIIKIGTLATSHLQLKGEGIARMHTVIEMAAEGPTVIDLGAAKQTTVNLEPVHKRVLVDGDVLGIGDAELVVRLQPRQDNV